MPEPTLLTYAHLQSYPLVGELVAYLYTFSVFQVLLDLAAAVATRVHAAVDKTELVHKAAASADAFVASSVLGTVDKYVPALQLLKWADIKPLAVAQYVSLKASASVDQAKLKAGEVVGAVQKAAATQYEKNRATIVSVAGPVVKPVNKVFGSAIDKYLPAAEEAAETTASEAADELEKLTQLTQTAYTRLSAIALHTASELQKVPGNIQQHVSHVYAVQKELDPSTPRALAKTGVQLGAEISSHIRPVLEPVVGRVEGLTKGLQARAADVLEGVHVKVAVVAEQAANGTETAAERALAAVGAQ